MSSNQLQSSSRLHRPVLNWNRTYPARIRTTTRRICLNFMGLVRGGRRGVPFLEPAHELVGAPDDQDDGPEPPHGVPEVDVELVEQEEDAEGDQDDAPDERIVLLRICHG